MGSVMLLWFVSILARDRGSLAPFLPFFLYAILMNVRGAFLYYEVDFTMLWYALELSILFSYLWLFAIFIHYIIQKP